MEKELLQQIDNIKLNTISKELEIWENFIPTNSKEDVIREREIKTLQNQMYGYF